MPTPGLYPRSAPRLSESRAEETFYDALSRSLPSGWFAWHSLKVRDRFGVDGEADFVVVDPQHGLLVIEVKGGRIEVRNGEWLQNGRAMQKAPRAQALGFAAKLRGRLQEDGARVPSYGVVSCFPDTAFSVGPSQGDVRDLVLGRHDLLGLRNALPGLMRDAIPEGHAVESKALDALHRLWCETWTPTLSLGRVAEMQAADRIRLDAEQLHILDALDANDRLLVEGCAGSGKSLLASAAVQRAAASGKRTLLLCYTDALAASLQRDLAPAGIKAKAIREYSAELLRAAGAKAPSRTTNEGWSDAPVSAAELVKEPFDVVIVDEAQDFADGDWLLVDALVGKGRLWAFADEAQAFWDDRKVDPGLFNARFKLTKPYRTPSALWQVAHACASGEPAPDAVHAAVEQRQLEVVACTSDNVVTKKVASAVQRLRGEGFKPSDIAVLSLRGLTAKDKAVESLTIADTKAVRADAADADNHLVADTFLRFKGLERPAVIITGFESVTDKRAVRMHIALTRALSTATIVAPKAALVEDPVLRAAVSA